MPPQSKLDSCKDDVIAYYIDNHSLDETAKQFNSSCSAISRFLDKHGVKTRDLSSANSLKWTTSRKKAFGLQKKGKQSPAKGKNWKMNRPVARPGLKGEKNPQWKNGKTKLSFSIRQCHNYKVWRHNVFARDNWTCVFCGNRSAVGSKVIIHADHVIPLSRLLDTYMIKTVEQAELCIHIWDVGNGRTLCKSCHKKTPTYGVNRNCSS